MSGECLEHFVVNRRVINVIVNVSVVNASLQQHFGVVLWLFFC